MRVVDVNRVLFRKIRKRPVLSKMIRNDILKRGRNEKILLGKPQDLSLHMIVGGIKHLREHLRARILLDRLHVLPLCEELHVEIRDILRLPKAQIVRGKAPVARYHHVVRHRLNLIIIGMRDFQPSALPALRDLAAEADGKGLIRPCDKPALGARHPNIGKLHLISVDDLLLEQTVFI